MVSTSANAATVLDFEGVLDVVTQAKDDAVAIGGFGHAFATFRENGFLIDLVIPVEWPEQRDGMLGLHQRGGGAGDRNTRAAIRHEDGLAFTFDAFVLGRVVSILTAYYSDVDVSLALQWPALELIGTLTAGARCAGRCRLCAPCGRARAWGGFA